MDFDASKAVEATVKWIQDWFAENGPDCNAIIGITFGETLIAGILEESPPIPLRYLFLKLVSPHKMWIVQPPERVLQAG